MREFQCVATPYVTEIKETYFEIYIYPLPQSVNQYLHDSFTTKFDFMNYAFAKLVLA